MKTIIAGSRDISNYAFIEKAIVESGFEVSLVLSGCARGVDQLAEKWAEKNNVPVYKFPPDWKKYKRGAGPVRNRQMAEFAEACIVLWDGKSPGTKNMISLAKKYGLSLFVFRID